MKFLTGNSLTSFFKSNFNCKHKNTKYYHKYECSSQYQNFQKIQKFQKLNSINLDINIEQNARSFKHIF